MAELIGMPSAAWRRQPSGRVSVDWSHEAARSLVYAAVGGPSRNLVTGAKEIIDGSVVTTTNSVGFAAYNQSSGVNAINFTPLSLGSDFLVLAVAQSRTLNTNQQILADDNLSVRRILQFRTSAAGKLQFIRFNDSVGVFTTESGRTLSTYRPFYAIGWSSGVDFGCLLDNDTEITGQITGTPRSWTSSSSNTHWFYRFDSGNRQEVSTADLMLRCVFSSSLLPDIRKSLLINPWQLFAPDPPRFYLIPSSGGSSSQTASIDALIQRAGLTQSTSIDALLQSAFSRSLSLDGLIAAVQIGVISLDALLQIVGTRTLSVDALLQSAKTGTVSVDALVQMTLSQSLSLDALIVAASASSASTDLDALIQALKTAGISLDALLSQSKTATAVMDALIQAAKTGTVSLDAIITGASSTTVFVGLDALIQAIQAKTISLDALLQKSYTSPLALDAYVALTQVKTMSLDALLQSTKSGVISMDAILQMTKTAMVSFDALIQAAKTGVISLDAILVFATQASVLLDAYVQKTLARGVGLDAIIGSIADMILPTGRVITVPASDRFVFITHSDRVIQIQ